MAQVSKKHLPKSLEENMHGLLRQTLADLHSEQDVAEFLDDLLTPTEKVMLGKRLAIAVLLDKGYDQRTIHSMMRVSVSTVNTVNYWLTNKGDGYRKVIARIKGKQQWKNFLEKLDRALDDLYHVNMVMYPGMKKR